MVPNSYREKGSRDPHHKILSSLVCRSSSVAVKMGGEIDRKNKKEGSGTLLMKILMQTEKKKKSQKHAAHANKLSLIPSLPFRVVRFSSRFGLRTH